jgi:adenylate kinase family enzyme
MTRVAVIGNAGGGKSTLARALASSYSLPYLEVDKIQWQPGWMPAPEAEVRARIGELLCQTKWVVDGFGPWDTIEKRFEVSDTIIYVDLPLWVHYWWATERLLAAARGQDVGEPEGCSWNSVTERLFKLMWDIHHDVRPRLLELIERHRPLTTVYHLRSPEELNGFVAEHCRTA